MSERDRYFKLYRNLDRFTTAAQFILPAADLVVEDIEGSFAAAEVAEVFLGVCGNRDPVEVLTSSLRIISVCENRFAIDSIIFRVRKIASEEAIDEGNRRHSGLAIGVIGVGRSIDFKTIFLLVPVGVGFVWIGACLGGAHKSSATIFDSICQSIFIGVGHKRVGSRFGRTDKGASSIFIPIQYAIIVGVIVIGIGSSDIFFQIRRVV